MRETETKLDVPPAFQLPDLTGAVEDSDVADKGVKELRATYWDTKDLRLIRAGVTLRHRRQPRATGEWQLKLPVGETDDALDRLELAFPGSASRPPRDVRDRVALHARSEDLVPVAKLHTRRRTIEVTSREGLVAEVVDDEVSVIEAGRIAARFRELEVESGPAGSDRSRRSITAALIAAGAADTGQDPKVLRALGRRAREPDDLTPPSARSPGDREPAQWATAEVLARRLQAVRAADDRVRGGEADAIAAAAAALDELAALLTVVGAADAAGIEAARDAFDDLAAVTMAKAATDAALTPIERVAADGRIRGRRDLEALLTRVEDAYRDDALMMVSAETFVTAFDCAVSMLQRADVRADADPRPWWEQAHAADLTVQAQGATRLHAVVDVAHAAGQTTAKTLSRAGAAARAARRRRQLHRAVSLVRHGPGGADDAAVNAEDAAQGAGAHEVEDADGDVGRLVDLSAFPRGAVALHVARRLEAANVTYADALEQLDGKRLRQLLSAAS